MTTATVPSALPMRGTVADIGVPGPDDVDPPTGWLGRSPSRAHEPFPGTVAARNREPLVVTTARVMVVEGFDIADIVREIERLGIDRDRLENARTYWVRQLGRRPSDDFDGHRVLKSLEAAHRSHGIRDAT